MFYNLGLPTIKNASGVIISESTIGNTLMFTGRMWDAELGIYDYRNRVYNPAMGVFYQTDPLGYADSTNMYAYCLNDPVNFVDPFGLCKESWWQVGLNWASYNVFSPFNNTLFYPGYNYGEWVYGEKNIRTFYGASLDSLWLLSGSAGAVQTAKSVTAAWSSSMQSARLLDANTIRFSQDNIKQTFRDGKPVQGLINGLKSGKISPEDVTPIRIFKKGKEWFTLDNRRLYAAQQAGKKVNTIVVSKKDFAKAIARKLTTRNNGISIRVRGGK